MLVYGCNYLLLMKTSVCDTLLCSFIVLVVFKIKLILTIQCVTITHAFVVGVKPRLNIVDILKPAEDMIEVQTTQEPIAGNSNHTDYCVVATYEILASTL